MQQTTEEIQKSNKKVPLICIKDVDVAYQDIVALLNINLDIYENEIVGIFGPNASGKSTLFKVILGLVKPINGSVKFFDCQYAKPILDKLHIGYVPQVQKIDRNFPALVRDVVSMGRYRKVGYFKNVKDDDSYVEGALNAVGMWRFRNRPIGHLSGGQQQKVMIARALSSNPQIILLDEPTAALDFRIQRSIMELIQDLQKKKRLTILLITHNIDFLKKYTSRIILLNKRIFWKGSPTDPQLDSIIQDLFYQ